MEHRKFSLLLAWTRESERAMPCHSFCIITGTSSTFALCELVFLSHRVNACINYGNKGLAFGAAAAAFYASPFSIQKIIARAKEQIKYFAYMTKSVVVVSDTTWMNGRMNGTEYMWDDRSQLHRFISTGTVTQYAHTSTHTAEIQYRAKERKTRTENSLNVSPSPHHTIPKTTQCVCERANKYTQRRTYIISIYLRWLKDRREERQKKQLNKTGEITCIDHFIVINIHLEYWIVSWSMKVYCTHWPMYFLPVFIPYFVIAANKWNIIHPVLVKGKKKWL